MKKRHLLNILLVITTVCQLYGQDAFPGLDHMPSPQAADLGQFEEIPVSYFTGRADINVPIYSFTRKGVPLTIGLSYDTSGLLVNKLPGWVGPGWTLNTGGVITRIQQNYCDEMTFTNRSEYDDFRNYFQAHNDITNTDGTLNLTNLGSETNIYWKDYSPDKFYFNFLGFTGYFFLDCNGTWRVCSESNLVVEFDYMDNNNFIDPPFLTFPEAPSYPQPKAIKGFILYDDKGNQYIFGGSDSSIEYSINLFRTSTQEKEPWIATAWFLTQVKDRNDETLYSFLYEKGKYLVQLYRNDSSNNGYPYRGTLTLPVYPKRINVFGEAIISFSMNSPYDAGTAARHLYPCMYNQEIAKPLYLGQNQQQFPFYYLQSSSIQCSQYNVLSHPISDDPLASMDIRFLDKISIHWEDVADSITYQLGYSDTGRRHLESLFCIPPDGICHRYSFRYNSYTSLSNDYLTDQHDYWGYYNIPPNTGGNHQPYDPWLHFTEGGTSGDGGNNAPIPTDSIREPSLVYSKMGMLSEIVYPTGGKTVLDYELNDFSRIQVHNQQTIETQTGTAGGLRIKSIIEYDDSMGLRKLQERTFSYSNPYTGISSGQLTDNDGLKTCPTYIRNESPIIPLGSTFGTHIGYSFVTENMPDSTCHRYHYINMTSTNEIPSPGIQPAQPEMDPYFVESADFTPHFMRGKILDESIIDAAGTTVMEKSYRYRTDYSTYISQYSYAFNNQYYINDYPNHSISYYSYKLYFPKYDLARITQATMYEGNIVNDTTYISMITSDTITQDWQTVPMFRKCAFERTVRNRYSTSVAYSYSPQAHYYLPVTSTIHYVNDIPTRTDRTDFAFFNQRIQPQYEMTQIGNGPIDTLVTYHSYTNNGRPVTFTRKGEYPTTLYWSPSQKRLRASVTSPYSDLTLTPEMSQNLTPENVITRDGTSIFNFPNVRATTYVYDASGRIVGSATGNGQRRYYSYDSLNRLCEIRDGNNKVLQRLTYHYSTSSGQ